jgi:hypothetical protein
MARLDNPLTTNDRISLSRCVSPWRAPGQNSSRCIRAAVSTATASGPDELGAWVTVAQGVIFVICVLTFRRGVVGEIANLIKKPL